MTTRVPIQMTGLAPGDDIQAAVDALPANGGIVKLGPGTHTISTSLELRSGVILEGEGSQSTVLSYTGNAAAIVQMTPGVRVYGLGVRRLRVQDDGTGTIGLDLNSVSTSVFEDLVVNGFPTGVYLLGANGFCVYNRFTNVTVQNATTGWAIGAAGSNSNSFIACRANVCTTGWDITDSNQNHLEHCQVEQCTTGVSITASGASLANRNSIAFCRFENCTTNINITSANAIETALVANHHVTGTNVDNGVRTLRLDPFGAVGLAFKVVSAAAASATGNFEFERTTNGGSSLPAFVVRDSNTGSGTPVTVQAETERLTGSFFRGRRGGVTYFEAYASGALGIADGITAPGTVAGMAQIYVDTADGDLKIKFGDGVVKTIVVDT